VPWLDDRTGLRRLADWARRTVAHLLVVGGIVRTAAPRHGLGILPRPDQSAQQHLRVTVRQERLGSDIRL
jgi:hypothetical protein